jgi:drug/metabolite transporter (DMT)-like permease
MTTTRRGMAASRGGVTSQGAAAPSASGSTRALLLGISASAFFAITFVLNRSMANAGGHWAWTSSLRFHIMVPLLLALLTVRRQWPALGAAWRAAPGAWLTWGTVAFVVFYAPITYAGGLVPAWVIAGSWPVTIVAGLLLAPLIYRDHRRFVPRRALAGSSVIVAGVMLLQVEQATSAEFSTALVGLGLVLVSAAAYPLGNRKMMLALEERGVVLDPLVRLTAMTLGSLPAWLLVSAYGYASASWPSSGQLVQAGIIALSSGIIATVLFFAATDLVQRDPVGLAAVEATQAGEAPFALGLEVMILGTAWPGPLGGVGLAVIVLGIIAYARQVSRPVSRPAGPPGDRPGDHHE